MEANQHQQEQQQQSQHELAKLRAIENQVAQVQDRLATRLPHQHLQLIARVCGSIWLGRVRLALAAKTSNNSSPPQQQQANQYEQITKKVRLELGAFDYHVKEQAELLTRHLCALDDILSFGNSDVKDARKALVVHIQRLLTTADAFRAKSARLKAFGETLLATLPKPAATETVESEAAEAINNSENAFKDATEEEKATNAGSDTEDVEMKPLFAEEEEEEDEDSDDDESDQEEDDEADDMADDDMDEACQSEESDVTSAQSPPVKSQVTAQQPQQQRQPIATDIQSLPLWRPYYQLQKRRDGLYLIANLRDVEPQNLRVQWNEHTRVLRVSGHKLPTHKDVMVTRFSGKPTFGRFEIAERLPANAFNMERATQKLNEDGVLEIRMPYYLVQHPRFFGQRSVFEAPRCMVW